jgi:hypothetical protein
VVISKSKANTRQAIIPLQWEQLPATIGGYLKQKGIEAFYQHSNP